MSEQKEEEEKKLDEKKPNKEFYIGKKDNKSITK